jgi:hypothetical protein
VSGARVAAALALGVTTAAATVPIARMTMTAVHGCADVLLVRGTAAWQGSERRSAMIRWINVETVGPLVTESTHFGEVPEWAEPAPPPDARLVRAAAVAVGWPLPVVAAAWRADRGDEGFPPPSEYDTSGNSPKEAVRRLLDGDPKATRTLLLPGALADSLFFAVAWYGVIAAVAGIARRRAARSVDGHHRHDHAHDDRKRKEERDHPEHDLR